ncbi:hypothetical protein CLV63_1086 [Murinocardiopsis flavida]|uniref:DUF6542 domain-containing protein n=1 Tax=Murinocardiopsis flavida TaxID=645275 RepID=A0A2P8DJC2_9ACTN|nr:DUF6542 domain-containing protein [Murinocardiopsis flavida]PSK97288.1 hypothetical protein CLV63_1086 [Murinocardiopsis flavida]
MTPRDADGPRDPNQPHRLARRQRRPAGPGSSARGPAPSTAPLRLTARGAILIIVMVGFAAALADSMVALPMLNGIAFVAVCTLAAFFVRSTDLLTLSVSPPLAYFASALLAEGVLTLGSDGFARGVAIGLATRLADVAPWLFAGTALVLVITLFRGLPRNVRALSDELSGRAQRRAQK